MDRILLLHSSPVREYTVDPSLRIAPIGLFFLNGYLVKIGYETRIEMINPDQIDEKLCKCIREFKPDFIGYSYRNLYDLERDPGRSRKLTDFFSVSREKPVIDRIRAITDVPVIGGGAAFSLAPQLYMEFLGLDFGIIGEGEESLTALIHCLANSTDYSHIPGLVYQGGNGYTINAVQPINNLQSLPPMEPGEFPGYRTFYCENGGYGSIQTKRGCRFRCSYCLYPKLEGETYRIRDAETVIEEIRTIKERFSCTHFHIVDSVFSYPPEESAAFCKSLIRSGLNIRWAAYANPRGASMDLYSLYKRAGCHNLVLTLDSGSPVMLREFGKGFSIEEAIECIHALQETGIPFEVSMILGGPGETRETVEETVRFCDQYLADVPVVFFPGVWIHPQSPIAGKVRRSGYYPKDMDLSRIVLSNNFRDHNYLLYFFSDIDPGKKEQFLEMIFSMIRGKKRIIGNFDVHYNTRVRDIQYNPGLSIKRNQRPWYEDAVFWNDKT